MRTLFSALLGGWLLLAPPALAETSAFYASLQDSDQVLASATVQDALETARSAESRHWRNAQTGASGFVTPLRTYRIETGHFCRDYQEAISTPASTEARLFTACRSKEDGRWIPVTNKG